MTNELIWCPRGWLDGGSGAWAVSRKTPIYFMLSYILTALLVGGYGGGPFQLPRVIMWGLSLYCCVSHRCYTAEQRLTKLTITTSAAMSVLQAFVMAGAAIFPGPVHPWWLGYPL